MFFVPKVCSNSMKLGLVTVLYRNKSLLDDFFSSLSSQYLDFELVLVDNSNDNSVTLDYAIELANAFNISYTPIQNHDNLGVAEANNIGISSLLSRGFEYILLLNYDIVFGPDVIASLLSSLQSSHFYVASPKIFYHGSNLLWQAGGGFSTITGLPYHNGENMPNSPIFSSNKLFSNSSTCFTMFKSSIFHTVGLFDPHYFVYYDDSDWFLRFSRLGYNLIYISSVHIYHKVSVSTGGSLSDFSVFYSARNLVYYYVKHYTSFRLFLYLLLLLLRLFVLPIKSRNLSLYNPIIAGITSSFSLLKGFSK